MLSRRWLIASSLIIFSGLPWIQEDRAASLLRKWSEPLPIPPLIHIAPEQTEITLTLGQFQTHLAQDMPETTMWGYNGMSPGPTIEVEKGHALRVHWKNNLPKSHLLKAPSGMMNMDANTPDVRSITHLHGAVVSELNPMDRLNNNDGWPDAWNVPGEEQIADYPNEQSARILWYHDHASGTTGRNVAAGLTGMYIIRDDQERKLNLPSGEFEIPLEFVAHGINGDLSLNYTPDIGTEYYGNSVAVNGRLWPYLDVQPRKYRFRMLNASNARSYQFKLLDANTPGVFGPAFYQVGSDGGFLEKTVVLNDPSDLHAPELYLAPAERADVIIDFSSFAGKTLILANHSLDHGDGEIPINQVLMIKVATKLTEPDTSSLPSTLYPIPRIPESQALITRRIVLGQRPVPLTPMLTINNQTWQDPITEKPKLGSTEIWEIVDTLPDAHPFHLHLVNFQILDRRSFDVAAYTSTGELNYTGDPVSPDPNELAWKDTVRATPGQVTRIIIPFGPYPGFYVYHCHILEHEDMDMMRPFQVVTE